MKMIIERKTKENTRFSDIDVGSVFVMASRDEVYLKTQTREPNKANAVCLESYHLYTFLDSAIVEPKQARLVIE